MFVNLSTFNRKILYSKIIENDKAFFVFNVCICILLLKKWFTLFPNITNIKTTVNIFSLILLCIQIGIFTFFSSCLFIFFQDVLKKMRVIDDKIVYALNTSLPTESFQKKVDATSACADLYSQIQKGHTEREAVIKNCIVSTADTVKKLKAAKEEKPDDYDVLKSLKAEQRKV